ncbi:MAG: elongation factor 4 [Elusimicrobia bacterium RIFCSPLOWO2_01_FULL_59_12]|nr:MAG: elongation factor 4 [Elusimicrobia bacterium RIFCSPLOWO2_01_FULL_59_12]
MDIRNFCIIAHIDHGKSTLADRLLEITGTITARERRDQIMDGMELERERGITIKAKAVRMQYISPVSKTPYVLNLIDTPGHVDFTYEVSRALAACEGALLLVDATQGVEAQTLANATLARDAGLTLIPVINKTDLPAADPDTCRAQIREVLGIVRPALLASAKSGQGISEILEAIVNDIPPPPTDRSAPLKALVFDSVFDPFRGVVVYVRILEGEVTAGMALRFMMTGRLVVAEEVGVLQLKLLKADSLGPGEVGYLILGLKELGDVRDGDTLTSVDRPTATPHPGYKELKPFVFAGIYPVNPSDYDNLKKALEKLHLSDSAFTFFPETSSALGFGYRAGFLGLLHLDIIKTRVEREFQIALIVTAPNVVYHVIPQHGEKIIVDNPAAFPDPGIIKEIHEPYVSATIVTPADYVGPLMQLCQDRRGLFHDMKYLSATRVALHYDLPLAEIVSDFYNELKSMSKGYASFDYEHTGHSPADLVKMEIVVNGEVVDAFSLIVHQQKAYDQGRHLVESLKALIPRQMFEIPLQARIHHRIIARETIPALRKDVLSKCYGGDITRKRKLLEKQKEGKKKMKQFGQVEIPQEAFMAILRR